MWRRLGLFLALCVIATPLLVAQTIEGQVINAATGEAVSGARVRIFPADGPPANGYSLSADAQGRFRIESAKPGAYRAMYSAPGFGTVPNPGEMPAPFMVTNANQPVRLEAKLQPLSSISGRVLDSDGKPVPGAAIWLVRQDKWCMPPECRPDHREVTTGEGGRFTVKDLVPASWLVAATAPDTLEAPQSQGSERRGWAQTFLPGVVDPLLAQPVVLRPGTEQAGTDLKLVTAPLYRIAGRLLDPRGDPVPSAPVVLAKAFGPSYTRRTNPEGAFEFAAADDEWILSAAFDQNDVRLETARTIDLRGHDLNDVQLRLGAPFAVKGKVIMEVPAGLPAPAKSPIDFGLTRVSPLLSDGPGGFLVIETKGDSTTTRRAAYPGPHRVQFLSDAPVPYFLDSIRLGEQEALGTISLESDSPPLVVTFKLGGGTVRGTVEVCGSHHVFLVPQEPALRRNGFIRITGCDRDGHFEFTAVRPGEYYGISLATDPQSFADLANDRLLMQGSKVTVRANESTSADLRLRQ